MTKSTLVVASMIVMILAGLTGCTANSLYGMRVEVVRLSGPDTVGVRVHGQRVSGLVVYFHGSDQKARVILNDRRHTDLFDPILRAGYAVVAADAQGNAFGNPASQDDYRRLITAAQKKYVTKPLYFVAESMGALAALALLREDTGRQVAGMVGICPLMGLPPDVRAVNYVAGPWGGHVPEGADPLSWPPDTFADRSFRLYAATDDKVIPAEASAQSFADRFGSLAAVRVIECLGGHTAPPCYQGSEVQRWMADLR